MAVLYLTYGKNTDSKESDELFCKEPKYSHPWNLLQNHFINPRFLDYPFEITGSREDVERNFEPKGFSVSLDIPSYALDFPDNINENMKIETMMIAVREMIRMFIQG